MGLLRTPTLLSTLAITLSVIAYLFTNVRVDEDISDDVIQKIFMLRKLREVSVFFEKCHATICVGGCLFSETSLLVLHFLWCCLMNECGCVSALERGGQVLREDTMNPKSGVAPMVPMS